MVLCEHCPTKNSIDSQFCKGCGREISEAAREAAREENAKLIAEGYRMLGEGRTDEAELLASAVLEADEHVLGAWSLLGMIYERRGEHVGALECYEKVLQHKPDSALDKIKVSQLRKSIQDTISAPAKPSRIGAFAGALAAVILMVGMGAFAASIMGGRPAAAAETGKTVAVEDATQTPFSTPSVRPGAYVQNQNQPDPNAVQPSNTDIERGPAGPSSRVASNTRRNDDSGWRSRAGANVDRLPGADPNAANENDPSSEEIRPVAPNLAGMAVQPRPDFNDPQPDQKTGNQPAVQANTAKSGGGTIEINVHKGGETRGGGQDVDGDNKNGVEAVVRSARERHMSGQYDAAAKGYEQARRMGSDNGSVNQRLGMVYEKQGKKSEAAAAYQRAILHLEDESRKGKPGSKEALESAKQALKNLKSG